MEVAMGGMVAGRVGRMPSPAQWQMPPCSRKQNPSQSNITLPASMQNPTNPLQHKLPIKTAMITTIAMIANKHTTIKQMQEKEQSPRHFQCTAAHNRFNEPKDWALNTHQSVNKN
jgi:hypothetical protein